MSEEFWVDSYGRFKGGTMISRKYYEIVDQMCKVFLLLMRVVLYLALLVWVGRMLFTWAMGLK